MNGCCDCLQYKCKRGSGQIKKFALPIQQCYSLVELRSSNITHGIWVQVYMSFFITIEVLFPSCSMVYLTKLYHLINSHDSHILLNSCHLSKLDIQEMYNNNCDTICFHYFRIQIDINYETYYHKNSPRFEIQYYIKECGIILNKKYNNLGNDNCNI